MSKLKDDAPPDWRQDDPLGNWSRLTKGGAVPMPQNAEQAAAMAMRAALAAPAPQAPAWQPIETAPKDGTTILISDGLFGNCAGWNEEFDWWAVDDNKLGPFRLRGPAPTHWMPIPAAPQTKEPTNDR